jgi:hypothetical protein
MLKKGVYKQTKIHKKHISESTKGGNSTSFKKGGIGYWENKKRSKMDKQKIQKGRKGKGMGNKNALSNIPWNKGLNKNNDERIKRVVENKKGNKSNLWKGGLTEKNKLFRMSADYKIWRNAIFQRDDYTCQVCLKRGGELIVHHILPFSKFPELRVAINNGITLCHNCHKKTDSYGHNIKYIK